MSHKASLALLFASIPLLSCFKSGPRLADGPDQLESSELELLFPADPEAQRADLLDLLLCLQESLPTGCRFLEQGALEVVGQSPVDAGGIAEVWEGRMDGHKVATKSYRCYLASDRLLTCVRFYKEALTSSRLEHQNIVPFVGMYSTPEHPLALVFDFMDNLNLGLYLRGNANARRLPLLSDIAHGLEYMHKLNVVHGGIEIKNILVGLDGRARIAGLGAADVSSFMPGVDIDRFFEVRGAAPELVNPQHFGLKNARVTKESDAHAFGTLAYEIFAGEAPIFEEGKLTGAHSKFYGHRSSRPDHPELSDCIWKAIKGCLKKTPSQRKTIAEVIVVLEAELSSR